MICISTKYFFQPLYNHGGSFTMADLYLKGYSVLVLVDGKPVEGLSAELVEPKKCKRTCIDEVTKRLRDNGADNFVPLAITELRNEELANLQERQARELAPGEKYPSESTNIVLFGTQTIKTSVQFFSK